MAPDSPIALWARKTLGGVGHYGSFTKDILRTLFRDRWAVEELLSHAGTVGSRCALPVILTMVPFGAVIGLQGSAILQMFSAERLLSSLLSLFVVRELAPVIAAVLVAAQGGASFAAELGAMRLREELDATSVMAVDPVGWHVTPRVVAMVLVVPLLTMIGAGFGVLGGWGVAVGMEDQPNGVFLANLAANLSVYDLAASSAKGLVYGTLVGTLACWKGFYVTGGAEGVGRAVNDTVVLCVMLILVANYLLSSALFGGAV